MKQSLILSSLVLLSLVGCDPRYGDDKNVPGQLEGPYPRIVKNELGEYAVFIGQQCWRDRDGAGEWMNYYLFRRFAPSAYSWAPQDRIYTSMCRYNADWAISNGDSVVQVLLKDSLTVVDYMNKYLAENKAMALRADSAKKSITFH